MMLFYFLKFYLYSQLLHCIHCHRFTLADNTVIAPLSDFFRTFSNRPFSSTMRVQSAFTWMTVLSSIAMIGMVSAAPVDTSTATTNPQCHRKLIGTYAPQKEASTGSVLTTSPVSSTATASATPTGTATTTSKTTATTATTTATAKSGGLTGTNGKATYYTQDGAAGSCGKVNPDSAMIVAMNAPQYTSSACGKKLQITNLKTGKTAIATVADLCPGCARNSLDMSTGLFAALGGTTQEGVFPIDWKEVS